MSASDFLCVLEAIAGPLLSRALVQGDQGQRRPLSMLVGASLSTRYPWWEEAWDPHPGVSRPSNSSAAGDERCLWLEVRRCLGACSRSWPPESTPHG